MFKTTIHQKRCYQMHSLEYSCQEVEEDRQKLGIDRIGLEIGCRKVGILTEVDAPKTSSL